MNWKISIPAVDILITTDAQPAPAPTPAKLPAGYRPFPADNAWNTPCDTLPVDPTSALVVQTIGVPAPPLHPDFGTMFNGVPIGIPINVVSAAAPKLPVKFAFPTESDAGPYPIPPAPVTEAGSDAHCLLVSPDEGKLYELYALTKAPDGMWAAAAGAIFDAVTGAPRPAGWTSADAAGLPIFPGLVRWEEVNEDGVIDHALRFTLKQTRRAYVAPARHFASTLTGTQFPPMGARFRLKASVDELKDPGGVAWPKACTVIVRALKKYGMFLADNGSNLFLSGAPDSRWSDDELGNLKKLNATHFEMVQLGSLVTG